MNYNKDLEIINLKIELTKERLRLLYTQAFILQNENKQYETEKAKLEKDSGKYDDIANEKLNKAI